MSNLNNGGLTRVLNYIKTWVNGLLSGKSDTSHTHTKSQITDFPSIPSKTSDLTNDSGYLTSHQSLANYVTLNSSQTITATKTISANLNFSTTYTRGTAPSSTIDKELLDYRDSAGNRICLFDSTVFSDKSSRNAIFAYNTSVASGANIGYLGIGSKTDGSVFTHAPTPSASDNSTQIATTAWVTSKGYITSSGSCNYANSAGSASSASSATYAGYVQGTRTFSSYVNAVKYGNSFVTSNQTGFSTIWNAPTKNYRVGCAVYPNSNDNVYLCYSVSNANVNSSTNTVTEYCIWNAGDGTLCSANIKATSGLYYNSYKIYVG